MKEFPTMPHGWMAARGDVSDQAYSLGDILTASWNQRMARRTSPRGTRLWPNSSRQISRYEIDGGIVRRGSMHNLCMICTRQFLARIISFPLLVKRLPDVLGSLAL